jgi:hypothetical protein
MGGVPAGGPHSLRVVLVNCEGVLGDIITRAVTEAPGIDVVGTVRAVEVGPAILAGETDLVLWNDADERRLEQFLVFAARRRTPRVLATLSDGRDATLWKLVPWRTPLGSLSPTSLIEAIRDAVPSDDWSSR